MLRFTLPGTDSALLLSPRLADLAPALQIAILIALCLLPIGLTALLYRYELQLIRRSVAMLLFGLRLVVLFLILFLVCLQPVFARAHTEELPGRVVIAVDRSDSSDVADPQREPVEKLRLALGLKIARETCPEDLLRDWISQYEQHGEIKTWVRDNEAANDSARRQLETERREKFAALVKQVDGLTRTDIARLVLSDEGGALLKSIGAKHKVEVIGFTQDAWDVKPDALAELFQRPGVKDGQPASGAAFTDLRLPLVRALERSGTGEGKVLGVVLLTDGQHNWGQSPVKKAQELGDQKMPIFPVALGSHKPPPDVAVVSVSAPSAVFKDVDTQVEARVKVSGIRDKRQLVVQLQREGQEPLEETIAHDGSDRYYTVRFQTRLDKPGTQTMTVVVKPTEGETRPDNNSRAVIINVADDKAKVLIVEGEARWEYHYLASALARDKTMQPQSVVFLQPRLDRIPEDELRKAGNPWRLLPAEPDALLAYDCIILGDVAPEQLPLADRQRLEKYVADRGGTLVVLAGKRWMPEAYTGADNAGEADPITKMLPIEQPHVIKPTQGFPVTLSYDGNNTPFLQMEPEPAANAQRWASFPLHYWGVIGKAKPAASVLAYVEDGGADAKKDAADRAKNQALIARHNYGFGRVLFVGIDSTWRWRYREGDTYHHKFWGQTIRWASADKPLVTGNEFVRFGTREPIYRQKQDVDLVVRLSDDAGTLPPDALAGARILRLKGEGATATEESVALVPVTRREGAPRILDGKIRDLPAGKYAVELVIPELKDKLTGAPGPDGQPQKMRAPFTVLPPDGEEMVELATNYPLLEELASKSGGQVFEAENTAGLVEALTKRAVLHEDRVENRLWQWWVTLVLVLGLLTVEWVARKWAGLP